MDVIQSLLILVIMPIGRSIMLIDIICTQLHGFKDSYEKIMIACKLYIVSGK